MPDKIIISEALKDEIVEHAQLIHTKSSSVWVVPEFISRFGAVGFVDDHAAFRITEKQLVAALLSRSRFRFSFEFSSAHFDFLPVYYEPIAATLSALLPQKSILATNQLNAASPDSTIEALDLLMQDILAAMNILSPDLVFAADINSVAQPKAAAATVRVDILVDALDKCNTEIEVKSHILAAIEELPEPDTEDANEKALQVFTEPVNETDNQPRSGRYSAQKKSVSVPTLVAKNRPRRFRLEDVKPSKPHAPPIVSPNIALMQAYRGIPSHGKLSSMYGPLPHSKALRASLKRAQKNKPLILSNGTLNSRKTKLKKDDCSNAIVLVERRAEKSLADEILSALKEKSLFVPFSTQETKAAPPEIVSKPAVEESPVCVSIPNKETPVISSTNVPVIITEDLPMAIEQEIARFVEPEDESDAYESDLEDMLYMMPFISTHST
ncbi:hypothetical protein METSCH_A07320 [Metschnikowia aff. pulcherrima]|uniref:Uncharacterized protein n=1 Tax=Metschnikowia aff. pulcherrima TaxID=2163413 RepID=A0A4P6XFH5_9ASCO|nr:hypothetical protein METSCH_A07320 [Metschnikowia aff. pulcherrima]